MQFEKMGKLEIVYRRPPLPTNLLCVIWVVCVVWVIRVVCVVWVIRVVWVILVV